MGILVLLLFQVWRGSLLACDYLLFRRLNVEGKRVLELGSGAGLSAVAASLCGAAEVAATDLTERIPLMEANFARNAGLLSKRKASSSFPRASPFDLLRPVPEVILEADFDLVLAADLAYDDRLSEGVAAR